MPATEEREGSPLKMALAWRRRTLIAHAPVDAGAGVVKGLGRPPQEELLQSDINDADADLGAGAGKWPWPGNGAADGAADGAAEAVAAVDTAPAVGSAAVGAGWVLKAVGTEGTRSMPHAGAGAVQAWNSAGVHAGRRALRIAAVPVRGKAAPRRVAAGVVLQRWPAGCWGRLRLGEGGVRSEALSAQQPRRYKGVAARLVARGPQGAGAAAAGGGRWSVVG